MLTLHALFDLPKRSPQDVESDGQYFRRIFVSKGGLAILETLQEDGGEEIYELAKETMKDYFADDCDTENQENMTMFMI